MKMPGGKFQDLQRQWYKILEESGFQDIEKLVDGELVLKQTAAHNLWDIHPLDCQMEEEYFRLISHKVSDEKTEYRHETHKMIMQLHANGAKIKEIMDDLKTNNKSRSRRHIRTVIRQYVMTWDIKYYTPEELNKYPKKKR